MQPLEEVESSEKTILVMGFCVRQPAGLSERTRYPYLGAREEVHEVAGGRLRRRHLVLRVYVRVSINYRFCARVSSRILLAKLSDPFPGSIRTPCLLQRWNRVRHQLRGGTSEAAAAAAGHCRARVRLAHVRRNACPCTRIGVVGACTKKHRAHCQRRRPITQQAAAKQMNGPRSVARQACRKQHEFLSKKKQHESASVPINRTRHN